MDKVAGREALGDVPHGILYDNLRRVDFAGPTGADCVDNYYLDLLVSDSM